MIDLAVLDMAGTTIDEGGAVYDALERCVADTGAGVDPEQLQRWMGTDKREAIAALLGKASTPQLVEACYSAFREHLAEAYAASPPRPLPGIPAALAALRAHGIKVALTTGFAHDVADPLLQTLGWIVAGQSDQDGQGPAGVVVDAVVCADDVAAGRPAPYLVFHAMEATGVARTDRVLVAGDTAADLGCGNAAGAAYVVAVLTGRADAAHLGAHRHTHLLRSVADLPAMLAVG